MNENKAKEIMKRNPIKGWPEHAELMEAKGYLECLEKAKPLGWLVSDIAKFAKDETAIEIWKKWKKEK